MTLCIPVVESTYFKRQNTIYTTVAGDSRSTDSESADDCTYDWMLQKFKKQDHCDDVDETDLFFNLQHCVLLSMATPAMVKKFKTAFTVLHTINNDGSDKTITVGNWQI